MSNQKAARKGPQPPKTLVEFLGMMLKQAFKGLLRQIPWMILIGGFTWVFHTYLLVFINQGFDLSGTSLWIKAALSGNGSQSGTLFWTLMAGIASFGFTQLRQNGLGKTFHAIGTTPGWVAGSLKDFSIARLPLLLGSLAAGLLIMSISGSPLYAIQFGLLLIGEYLAQGKGLLGMVLPLGWSDMQRWFKRKQPPRPFGSNWMALILVGLSLSAFSGLIFPVWLSVCGLFGVVILIVVLLVTRTGRPTPSGTIMLLALLLAGALAIRFSGIASADDGGWSEAGGSLASWLRSEGAWLAVMFGLFPAFGSGLGWLFGSSLAGLLEIPETEVETGDDLDWVTDPEVKDAVHAWQKEMDDAKREAEAYRKQWDEVKDSYDVNDPNYQKLKDQYTQYIDYQNQRADQAKNQIDQILSDEAKAQQEQRSIDAYKQHRDAEAGWIDEQRHKLETRDTDFDRQMDRNVAERKHEAAQLEQAQKIRAAALDHGLGDHGEPGDVVKRSNEIINDILSGKHVDQQDIDKMARVVKDRVSGATAKQGEAYIPQDYLGGWIQLPSTMGELADGILGSYRTAFTGANPDGSTNLAAIAGRIGLGLVTGGLSEWGFVPANMAYNSKDAIDRGASEKEALQGAVNQAAFDIVAGKAIGGAIGLTGKGFKYVFPGTAKTLSKTAAKIAKAFQGAPEPRPIPTAHLDSVNRMLKSAVKSGDEKALLNLYKNGGMKSLAQLEQLGHVTPEAAKQLNKALTKAANQAIDRGTERAIGAFQQSTGVKIKRVYVGDSGSSAKGGPRSVRTDFDRTTIPEFEPKSVRDYASKNGISPAQAERQLADKFSKAHFNEVNQSLKQSGMPGGAGDVDYKTYNGIATPPAGAGPTDVYPYNYTARRAGLGGKTKVYVPKTDPAGKTKINSYETSGEAQVDADGLSKLRTTGEMPGDPLRAAPHEMPGVINQQAMSAASHNDVKSLAKALGRTEEASRALNIQNPELDELFDMTGALKGDPQGGINNMLQANHLTEQQFIERARSAINQVNDTASQMSWPAQ